MQGETAAAGELPRSLVLVTDKGGRSSLELQCELGHLLYQSMHCLLVLRASPMHA